MQNSHLDAASAQQIFQFSYARVFNFHPLGDDRTLYLLSIVAVVFPSPGVVTGLPGTDVGGLPGGPARPLNDP